MSTHAKTAKAAAKAAQVLAEKPTVETYLHGRQAAAAHARAALAAARANGTVKKQGVRRGLSPDEKTVMGRIDTLLARKGMISRKPLEHAMGVSPGLLSMKARVGGNFKLENLLKAAEFLGCTVEWLRDGGAGSNGADGAPVVLPHATQVFKRNGKAPAEAYSPGKLDASMHTSLDTAIVAMAGLLPLDVKAYLVARMSELLAMQARKASS
jgi:hypothetical protein